jgi:hypothetical protein
VVNGLKKTFIFWPFTRRRLSEELDSDLLLLETLANDSNSLGQILDAYNSRSWRDIVEGNRSFDGSEDGRWA